MWGGVYFNVISTVSLSLRVALERYAQRLRKYVRETFSYRAVQKKVGGNFFSERMVPFPVGGHI